MPKFPTVIFNRPKLHQKYFFFLFAVSLFIDVYLSVRLSVRYILCPPPYTWCYWISRRSPKNTNIEQCLFPKVNNFNEGTLWVSLSNFQRKYSSIWNNINIVILQLTLKCWNILTSVELYPDLRNYIWNHRQWFYSLFVWNHASILRIINSSFMNKII